MTVSKALPCGGVPRWHLMRAASLQLCPNCSLATWQLALTLDQQHQSHMQCQGSLIARWQAPRLCPCPDASVEPTGGMFLGFASLLPSIKPYRQYLIPKAQRGPPISPRRWDGPDRPSSPEASPFPQPGGLWSLKAHSTLPALLLQPRPRESQESRASWRSGRPGVR